MQDFAALLLDARNRAGLTQAQLAVSAGLTPSYLSFIENRKKPPPSDDVCRRLAKVLKIPARAVLEVAHMERAPEALQKKVRTLTHSLRRERRSRQRILKSLLSPFLFAGPPGFRESALDVLGISSVRRKRIREVLAAVGRSRQDREKQISRIIDELPERERALLLEQLPSMLGRSAKTSSAPAPAPAPATRPTPAATPAPIPIPTPAAEPPLLYEAQPGIDYLFRLEVSEAVAEEFEDLRAGDQLVVDPALRPALDDLFVLRGAEAFLVRRLEAAGEEFRLAVDVPAEATTIETLDAHALGARLKQTGAGTVVEIRRPLRRRSGRGPEQSDGRDGWE